MGSSWVKITMSEQPAFDQSVHVSAGEPQGGDRADLRELHDVGQACQVVRC